MKRLLVHWALVLLASFISAIGALAEPAPSPSDGTDDWCAGVMYKAKKSDVPIYREARETSKVVARIEVGERVCYIGEEGKFAILQWTEKDKELKEEELRFARASDLRPVKVTRPYGSGGFFDRIRQFYYYIRSGGVPEYSPVLPSGRGVPPQEKK